MISRTVRAGLLACVAPQRARAACRAGGQLLTTPRGSPFTGMICRPSGLGVLGSGWGTSNMKHIDGRGGRRGVAGILTEVCIKRMFCLLKI